VRANRTKALVYGAPDGTVRIHADSGGVLHQCPASAILLRMDTTTQRLHFPLGCSRLSCLSSRLYWSL